jgi:ABC-2 type transport system ATP-binding protein
MRRRLNIACAIVHRPKLLIMDEPTVGIDPQSRNHIIESIKELNRSGASIIYTSHYMEEVEELCNSIVIMDQGRVLAKGTKEELTALVSGEEKLELVLTRSSYTLVEQLRKVRGVTDCILAGNAITILSAKNSRNVSQIISCVSETGDSEVVSLTSNAPNLESVFLTLTGRSLRDQ